MSTFTDLLNSKKFVAVIGGILLVLVAKYVLHDDATATKIMGMVMAYLVAQGLADTGKEAKKIEAIIPPQPETVVNQTNISGEK
jgi:hypothetical protein